jgi:DNA-directed RNA polymerase subunit RPC12/RpoP
MPQQLVCLRCGNIWVPRKIVGRPSRCPKCMSPLWDKEYVRDVAGADRLAQRRKQKVAVGKKAAK